MNKKIKHIFFDLDNTLWDTDKNSYITLKEMFNEKSIEENYKLSFSDFYNSYYIRNEKLWELFRDNKVDKQDILEQRFKNTFQEFGVNEKEVYSYFDENFLNRVVTNNHLVDNAIETLEYLKEMGYQLHVISNGFITPTERKIFGTPIKEYITTITSGEEINKRKPAKEVFELGMKKAGATIEESSFIGDDWEADVLGSNNIGMFSVFFDYKQQTNSAEKSLPVIKNLIELKNIF